MKQQLILRLIIALTAMLCSQCDSKKTYTTTVNSYAADNLDLKAVTALATTVKSAEELEAKLNDPATKINNLDLNEDDEIDYIKVTEIAGEQKGFSLTVEVPSETGIEEQEVATIQFDLNEQNSRVQTHGNPYLYGAGFYYFGRSRHSGFPIRNYFSRDHTPHRSQFGATNKPSNFTSSKPLPPKDYTAYHRSNGYGSSIKLNNSSSMQSSLKSPNANKVANNIKAPLKNPSTAQKSFQRTSPSKHTTRVRSASSSRYGSSSSSRSRSSFGGGK